MIFGGNVMEGKIKDEVGDRSPSEVTMAADMLQRAGIYHVIGNRAEFGQRTSERHFRPNG